jgi:hypothetical protein
LTVSRFAAALALVLLGLTASTGIGAAPAGAGVPTVCAEPDEATAFVCRAYESFARREVSTAEAEYWAPQLPARRTSFIATLARSVEAREETVTAYYEQFDVAPPGPIALDYWVGEVLKPNGLRRLEAALSASIPATATEWVAFMYDQYLARGPGANERSYWTGRVAARGRNLTAADIEYSREARLLRVQWTYVNELQYSPVTASREYWAERLRTGTSWLDLRIALRSSPDGYLDSNGSCAPSAPRAGPSCS